MQQGLFLNFPSKDLRDSCWPPLVSPDPFYSTWALQGNREAHILLASLGVPLICH